jgi:hypothetical protein
LRLENSFVYVRPLAGVCQYKTGFRCQDKNRFSRRRDLRQTPSHSATGYAIGVFLLRGRMAKA